MSFKSPLFIINLIALLGLIFFLWIAGFFGIWKHEIKDISEDAGDIFAQAYPVVKINFEKLREKLFMRKITIRFMFQRYFSTHIQIIK